ncbi:MAG: LlaJI family restriction endonuclease, partial [Alloprevotella sp.]|nr:LlaJI family restriction endonuclease [Alloprevotella sp.]
MKIFFEDYPYSPKDVSFLTDIALIELNEGRIKLPYVGYYYDVASSETIFILPKVFIIENKAFGRYTPGQLLNISEDNKKLTSDDKAFLFNLSAWLYQAISLFNERNMDNEITSQRSLAGVVEHRGEGDATMLDHVLALLLFNKTHQSLFTHIATIMHSGKYKVHWTKTIRTTSPLLKGNKPYYLDCKTKEKTINYDEELICLFYSTLDYLRQSYHFVVKHNLNFETEKPHRIASMIESGKGTRRLRGMRGKYFTDELVQLWHLLYAFYERAEEVVQKKLQSERLLVRNFNIVFEDMIDCLIGDSSIPMELKNQEDGKIVDHIYRDKSLIDGEDLYFIGDSKYYKEGSSIGKNSRYKQFTYARNVIQYNI